MLNKEQIFTVIYKKGISPITAYNPELTHNIVFKALNRLEGSTSILDAVTKEFKIEGAPKVPVEALGVELNSSIMIAGGLIKTGKGSAILSRYGEGAIEVGTFTFDERKGRPKIRTETLFDGKKIKIKRIEKFTDGTIINWMGLPNPGVEEGIRNMTAVREKIVTPILINVAQNPELSYKKEIEDDLRRTINCVYIFRPHGTTVNVSCPNVEKEGSREEILEDAIWTIKTSGKIFAELNKKYGYKMPRFVKIGPDTADEEIKKLAIAIKEAGFDGVVATSTTTDRTGPRVKYAYIQKGGLSGPLLFEKSLKTVSLVRKFDRELGGKPLVIMGCGGINGFREWKQMQEVGVDIAQVVSSFLYDPYFFKKINRDIKNDYMRKKYF